MQKIVSEYPKEMKALVLHGVSDLKLETVPVPKLKSGCVLLKVRAAGICSSDRERVFVTGTYHFPTIPGHEFAGDIVAVADDVDSELLGRCASVFPMLPCMECDACRIEHYAQCTNYNYFGSRCDGGFAEYIVVPKWNLVIHDESVSYAKAALSEPAAVGIHAINLAEISNSDNIAIIGTGTIGFMIACFAREHAKKVVICGHSEDKLKYANDLGFDVLNITDDDYRHKVKNLIGNDAFDVAFEAVGSNSSIECAIDLVGNFGKVVLLGNPKEDLNIKKNVYWSILRKQKQIIGSWNSSYGSVINDWKTVSEYMKNCNFDFENLITHRFDLNEYKDAFNLIKENSRGQFLLKAMLFMGEEE